MERERKRNQCLAQNLGQKRNKMEDKRGETEGSGEPDLSTTPVGQKGALRPPHRLFTEYI